MIPEWSRDKERNRGRSGKRRQESGNVLDFEHYQYFANESSSEKFHQNKVKCLSKLAYRVIETELTDKQRECVLLVYADGMKQKDVAAELGISESTVSRHLKSAQKKFDTALKYFECNDLKVYD